MTTSPISTIGIQINEKYANIDKKQPILDDINEMLNKTHTDKILIETKEGQFSITKTHSMLTYHYIFLESYGFRRQLKDLNLSLNKEVATFIEKEKETELKIVREEELRNEQIEGNGIRCPHCNYLHQDYFDHMEELEEEVDFEWESCWKTFVLYIEVEYTFRTYKNVEGVN